MNNSTDTQPTQKHEYIFVIYHIILLSSISKFGPMAHFPPKLALFSHTLNRTLKVVRDKSEITARACPDDNQPVIE